MAKQNPDVLIHLGPPKNTGEFSPKGAVAEVYRALGREGIYAAFTRGLETYPDSLDGQQIQMWVPGENEPGTGSFEVVRVIRDHNGALGPSSAGLALEASGIPLLNGSGVRKFEDKLYAAQSGIFGLRMVKTAPISADTTEKTLVKLFDGRHWFVKPSRSHGSQGVARTDRVSVENIAHMISESGKEYVMQPIIDSTIPFPAGIRYVDETSREIAEVAKERPKELRLFWFFGASEAEESKLDWLAVARFSKPEQIDSAGRLQLNDDYAYVDQDTIPDELVTVTDEACRRLVHKTGQREVSGAFDFVYGKVDGDDPRWLVGEGNFWQPVPPKHPASRQIFLQHTVGQITRMVTDGSAK